MLFDVVEFVPGGDEAVGEEEVIAGEDAEVEVFNGVGNRVVNGDEEVEPEDYDAHEEHKDEHEI